MISSSLIRRQLLPSFPRLSLGATRSFSSTPSSQWARIFLVGHLAADPETHHLGEKEIVRYTIGTEYGKAGNRQTSWFRVASFAPEGRQRDYLLSLKKGSLVAVEGDAALRRIEDHEGTYRSVLNISQRSIEVLRKPNTESTTDNAESDANAADSTEGS